MAQEPTNWRRAGGKFLSKGISTLSPDRIPAGKFAYLQNVRPWQEGGFQPRPGAVTQINNTTLSTPVHSMKYLSDPSPSDYPPLSLIVGASTDLYGIVTGTVTLLGTGYAGTHMSMVPWRPSGTPQPWMYVSDGAKSSKVNTAGTVYGQGIYAPTQPPTAVLAAPNYSVIDPFSSATGWINTGTTGTITQGTRISTTISQIVVYQTASGGNWYSMVLTSYPYADAIQAGDIAVIDTGSPEETVIIQAVYNQSGASTTIAAIVYDSGTTGLCTVQPTEVIVNLTPGMIFDIGGDYVVVTEVEEGPATTGVQTFRCSTPTNHAAGAAIQGVITLVAWCANTHAAGADFVVNQLSFAVSSGIGGISKATSVNLASIGNRQVQESDFITVAINIDNFANFTYGQIQFAPQTTSFSSGINYFYYQFQAGDLYPAVGSSWYLLQIPVSSLLPYGVLPGLTLENVQLIGMSFSCSGTINVKVASWWIGGTYGPLVTGGGQPYQYAYTFFSRALGVESNPSPTLRAPVSPVNQEVVLTNPQSPTDPQVDTINWYRIGGNVGTWQFIGSTPSSASTFNDQFSDTYAQEQAPLANDLYVPFATEDVPRYGTCTVVGTKVIRSSGAFFNTAWVPGSVILLNGVAHTIYSSPSDGSNLQILESGGIVSSAIPFIIQSPVIQGVPLPSMWGPYNGTTMFACGDKNNAGVLYWTQGNNPDATGLDTNVEVTDPSEPLIAGCVYNGRAYVFSSKRMFLITPNLTLNAQGQVTFQVQDIPNSLGLIARTGLAVGDRIYFIGPDGIYATDGQTAPKSLTYGDLRILFPHEGNPGVAVTIGPDTIYPPNFNSPLSNILSWYDNVLYFDYGTATGSLNTLALDLPTGGWYVDVYAGNVPPTIHYGEDIQGGYGLLLGCTNVGIGAHGYVFQAAPGQDNGTDMTCVVSTPAWDEGDPRSRKYYADYGTRMNPASAVTGVSVQPYFDNYTASANSKTFGAGASGDQYYTADILGGNGSQGVGQLARNISARISWTESVQVQILDWSAGWVSQPDDVYARGMYISDLGDPRPKWVQSVVIEADTLGQNKTITVYGDGTQQAQFSINHNGQQELTYSWNPPFVASEIELLGDETVPWRLFGLRWIYEFYPYLTNNWVSEPSDWGIPGYKFLRYAYIPLVSTADATLTVTVDGVSYSYTVGSTGGAYKKVYVEFGAFKGKLYSFSLTCPNPIRVMQQDVEVWYKNVNSGVLHKITPFGGQTVRVGAEA